MVHLLHPIFQLGRDENAGKSPYQIALSNANRRQKEEGEQEGGVTMEESSEKPSAAAINTSNDTAQIEREDELDVAHHRARSLSRSASIKRRLEFGHSLSDTHGNTWPYDHEHDLQSSKSEEQQWEQIKKNEAMHRAEVWGKRQTQRREWVQERIERGRALSDSTGGHWSMNMRDDKGEEDKRDT